MKQDKKILTTFNKKNIRYAILRNYENIEQSKDIDILIAFQDGIKVRNILKKHGAVRGLISDNRYDIKIGCMEYKKNYLEPATNILQRRQKKEYYYILHPQDELKHLILKSLGNGFTKKQYLTKIQKLLQTSNHTELKTYFDKLAGNTGKKILSAVKEKKYKEAIRLRESFEKKVNSPLKKIVYHLYRMTFPCLKRTLK